MSSKVYWRLYLCSSGQYEPVCMQDFDEHDYDQSKFLNYDKYENEELALLHLDQAKLQALKIMRTL